MADAPTKTVSVLGSCISRDNFNRRFNPGYKRWYSVGATTNQSSMIALMSPPIDEPWEPLEPMKPYGLWNVGSDLSREILTLLPQERPDVVVLDFFGDVHFGVLRLADGRYLTDNRWRVRKTDLHQRVLDAPGTERIRWQDDAERYFDLWVEAMDRFAAFLAAEVPDTQVVLHCGFNVDAVIPSGGTLASPMPPRRRRGARAGSQFWHRLNEHARSAYGWDHIDLGEEHWVTFEDHPWNAMAVHYTYDYYPRFLAELDRLVLRREVDPDTAAGIDAVAAAAADHVLAVAQWHRQSIARAEALAAERERPRWKRLLRPGDVPAPPAPPPLDGAARAEELLAEVRRRVDEATYPRVERLVTSARTHADWLLEAVPDGAVRPAGRG
ncbi:MULTISPECIES: DUF6270 domain-containing protein [unclassified Nocardioides]|uniref:DUF6270 domain-containing protein n=1 Tax=unclassified Nocardioides TaxID=2615069 RepID=UPI0007026DEB|nr:MULTISPECIES: DUF6270 domain-containing protein [unclassified Nocardioides]KRC54001.1 hypothetical protein ASE19_07955 [Nocardioides sp. Root79]KRC71337.1 hypothetical protein ASE20_10370 [Nocardioides sp. Root240]